MILCLDVFIIVVSGSLSALCMSAYGMHKQNNMHAKQMPSGRNHAGPQSVIVLSAVFLKLPENKQLDEGKSRLLSGCPEEGWMGQTLSFHRPL